MNTQKSYAQYLDTQDELQDFRNEFYISDQQIYFDGNSLGLLSKRSEKAVENVMGAWKRYAIDGWSEHPWFHLSEKLGGQLASLIGAESDEVIVTGSTTINLHQLVASFYNPKEGKTKILADELNFPSDIYALSSQLELHDHDPADHLIKVPSADGHTLTTEDIIAYMTKDVALIVLPSILYRSGQILDMETLTKEAHKRGILIGFDLCHSIGAIPHLLSDWGVDFAFWCTYKHLNGGPGSVAGLYVNKRHFGYQPGLAGWFSSNKNHQFDMKHSLIPANDAGAYQIGTPHILSAVPLIGALELFQEAGISRIREKSLRLTRYLMKLITAELDGYGFTIETPKDDNARGGHVLLAHPEAARICKALKNDGVIPDFRAPNGIRLAPVALYNTFKEVWKMTAILKTIMKDERYKQYENKRGVIA